MIRKPLPKIEASGVTVARRTVPPIDAAALSPGL